MIDAISILLTAGIEGGSRHIVETEWSWSDWQEISDSWQRTAPPTHITAHRFAGPSSPESAPTSSGHAMATPAAAAAMIGGSTEGVPVYKQPAFGTRG